MGREQARTAAQGYIDVNVGNHPDDGRDLIILNDFQRALRAQATAPTEGRTAFDPTIDYVGQVREIMDANTSFSFGEAAQQIARGVDPFTIPLLPRYTRLGIPSLDSIRLHKNPLNAHAFHPFAQFYSENSGLKALGYDRSTLPVMLPDAVMVRSIDYMRGKPVDDYVPHMLARNLDAIQIEAGFDALLGDDRKLHTSDIDSVVGQAVVWSQALTPVHAMKLFNVQESQMPNPHVQTDVRGFMACQWQRKPTYEGPPTDSPFFHQLASEYVAGWMEQSGLLKQPHMIGEMMASSNAEYNPEWVVSGTIFA